MASDASYVVCQATEPGVLALEVQPWLKKGYTTAGGVFVVALMEGFLYFQAVVKGAGYEKS